MQDVLEQNILRFWLDRMVDREHGGFYGRIDGKGMLHPEAEKGAILNARILWTFSAAYRVLGNPEYLDASRRAYDYLINHFIDKEYEQQATERRWIMLFNSMSALRNMHWIGNIMAILRLAPVSGMRLPICV